MTKSKAVMLFGLPVLLVAGYALYLLLLMQPGFTGSRVKIRTPICWTSRK